MAGQMQERGRGGIPTGIRRGGGGGYHSHRPIGTVVANVNGCIASARHGRGRPV